MKKYLLILATLFGATAFGTCVADETGGGFHEPADLGAQSAQSLESEQSPDNVLLSILLAWFA